MSWLTTGTPAPAENLLKARFFTKRSQKRIEFLIVLLIAICAYFFGQSVYLQHLDQAGFYQNHFLPPLHFACAGTFESFEPSPSVLHFLSSPQATFTNCDEVAALPKVMWGEFENGLIFLFGLAGFLWKFLGVSWANLSPIAGLLTAALAVSAYGLFRVFCRYPLISIIMIFIFITHSSVVAQMMHLRDFSKAPFMVAALALMAAAVLKPRTIRCTFLLAAVAGAVIAVALGFRPDVMAMLPIAIAAPVFTLGTGTWTQWCRRALALWLGLGLGFVLLRAGTMAITPPVAVGRNFLSHVFVLGFSDLFITYTQVMADGSYRILSPYFDEFVYGIVKLFQGGRGDGGAVYTLTYDKDTFDLLAAVFLTVPNDAFMRIFYTAQAMHKFVPLIWGPVLVGTICVLWVARRRALIFLSFCFAFLTAVASLQFDSRHIFFFGIFGLGLGSLLIDCLLSAWRKRLPDRPMAILGSVAGSLVAVLVGLSALVGMISLGTFHLQEKRIAESQALYERLEWLPVSFTQVGQKLVPGDDLFSTGTGIADQQNIALFARLTLKSTADATSCGGNGSTLTQAYSYIGSENIFKPWPLPDGLVRELYFPLIHFMNLQFMHLQFEGDLSGCDIDWHIAARLPPQTVPMELLVTDGQIQKSYRGSWQVLATRFIWE